MKIGAFAELTGISAYTLRYYEKKGLLFVKRGQNGVLRLRFQQTLCHARAQAAHRHALFKAFARRQGGRGSLNDGRSFGRSRRVLHIFF